MAALLDLTDIRGLVAFFYIAPQKVVDLLLL